MRPEMNIVYTFLTTYMEPLTSPFYLLFLLLLLSVAFKRMSSVARLMASISVFTVFFWGMYHLAMKNPLAAKWLYRLNSPLWLILAILVLPAIFLPRKWWYKYFLLLPAVFVGLSVLEIINQYTQVPAEAGFVWFPIRPEFLFAGVTGALVILQYLLPLDIFRKVTRITMLLLLIYGGFAFRQSYADYMEMLERRMEPEQDIMLIAEHRVGLSPTPGINTRNGEITSYAISKIYGIFKNKIHFRSQPTKLAPNFRDHTGYQ